jgi:hypothetical protein
VLKQGRVDRGPTVAERFLGLFDDHSVARGRIPNLVEGLSYRAVESPDALLAELRREQLVAASELFGVQLAWLEGAQSTIYAAPHCYKSPDDFFIALGSLSSQDRLPLRALSTTRNLDRSSPTLQRMALVLVERIPGIDEPEVDRYVPFADAWDWLHRPCRLQLKAMVRAYGRPVPIHEVDMAVIEAITDGQRVPMEASRNPLITEPSLEDYCLSRNESPKAREVEELIDVRAYAHHAGLPWNLRAWRRAQSKEGGGT